MITIILTILLASFIYAFYLLYTEHRDWHFNGWYLAFDHNFESNALKAMKVSGRKWQDIARHIEKMPVEYWYHHIFSALIDAKKYHKDNNL